VDIEKFNYWKTVGIMNNVLRLQHINRMPHNISQMIKKTTDEWAAEGTRGDHYRDVWMCETRMGQQMAQLQVS